MQTYVKEVDELDFPYLIQNKTAIVDTAYMRAAGTSGPVGVRAKLSQNSRLAMSTFQQNSVSKVPRKACLH